MLSTTEGWAVGKQGTILHFRDGVWERVYPANYYRDPSSYSSLDLFGVAMNSIRSGWIVGEQHFLTYSSEAWIEPDSFSSIRAKHPEMQFIPSLYGIAMAPSGEAWAVGTTDSYGSNTIVILHYQHDTWDIYS
jgi:hypothetical protein